MEKTLSKLYTKKKQSAFKDILETFEDQKYCIIDFLYFSVIVSQYLFSEDPLLDMKKKKEKIKKRKKKILKLKRKIFNKPYKKEENHEYDNTNQDSLLYKNLYPKQSKYLIWWLINKSILNFKDNLLNMDFLFPDWIALQLFYFCYKIKLLFKSWLKDKQKVFLPNINWTDFTPYFLEEIRNKYWNQKLCILLYWTTEKYIKRTKDFLTYKWYNVIYHQDWFTEFDWNKAEKAIADYSDTINVLLVSRSTPQIPIQTLRSNNEKNKISENNLIVFNVWWLFDHMIWVQKRAPKPIRVIKLERLRRVILYPRRNISKVINSLSVFFYIFHYLLLKKK